MSKKKSKKAKSPARRGFQYRASFPVFRKVLADLRKYCPAAMPVVVLTTVLPPTTLGSCARRQTKFVIRLNTFLNEHMAVDTLLHEWAHALSWNLVMDNLSKDTDMEEHEFEQEAHDEIWGCAYSRVWRVYIGETLPTLLRPTPENLEPPPGVTLPHDYPKKSHGTRMLFCRR